ncbi:MAG: sulfurtransferase [Fuerstiella sp.]|nr:sulfurtransferase [Fuerstiella sp.]
MNRSVVNIAGYKFVAISDLEERRSILRALTQQLELRGTILLSPEGINLFVAGSRDAADRLLEELHADPAFADLSVKESFSDYQPFNRMLVKIKKEIISFGMDGVDPGQKTSPKLSAEELKRWLDEGRPVRLLDVRNDYEVDIGTFENAIPVRIDHFRQFPDAVQQLPETMKNEAVVMFCTGGIRCEKAGPCMEQAGFRNVFQLDGGILKYFEQCGNEHYDGDCFVFDQRVAVDAALQETGFTQCFVCQAVVSPELQESEEYVPGKSCPECWKAPATRMSDMLQKRQARLREISVPLPGSVPYFNRRPLNVPERYAGFTLIDFLCSWHPQIERDIWMQKILKSEVVPSPRYGRRRRRMPSPEEPLPLSPQRVVRPGERLEHLLPATVEPDVDVDVRFLYEDEHLIVVDKPAPLPLHPSGRFNRNTLQSLLSKVYAPQRPLLVHRLDANTTGVLMLCRKRSTVRTIQKQFETGSVSKTYLARVHGHPADDEFNCVAAISALPGPSGLREIDDHDGRPARTEFRVVDRLDDGTCLLKVTPVTGRTNQIRLHLWSLGWPVVNDPVWLSDGSTGPNRTLSIDEPAMCLHAWSLKIEGLKGQSHTFTTPPPSWWNREISGT